MNLYDIDVAILAGVQRLPNGNTVVCNWDTKGRNGKKTSHNFEATPDGRIVWECPSPDIGQMAQCFILGTVGKGVIRKHHPVWRRQPAFAPDGFRRRHRTEATEASSDSIIQKMEIVIGVHSC